MTPPDPPYFKHFESLHRCTVCGTGQLVSLFPPDVSRCGRCHMILRQTRPTQEDVLEMHERALADRMELNYELSQTADARQAETERLRKNLRLVQTAMGPQQEAGRILLDVGAGNGNFMGMARNDGWLVVGTELSAKAAELVQRTHGLEMLAGQLTEIGFAGRTFDAITLWDTLDYLPNPGEALQVIQRLLKPRGTLFITVANADATLLQHKLKKAEGNPLGELAPGSDARLTHFQAKTLRNALKVNGYEIKDFGGEGKSTGAWWTAPLKGVLKLGAGMDLSPALHCVAAVDRNPDRRPEDFE